MKRSSSPGNDNGPAQKRHHTKMNQYENQWNQYYKQADTSGKVVWSGTVKIPDEIVFDCSIKTLPQDEGIKSLFPQKPYTIHIIPVSTMKSLRPYRMKSRQLILCTDENNKMSYSAFSQAIRLGSSLSMMGFTVLKNSASTLHLLIVFSFTYEHEDYIVGAIETYQANDKVLGILRSHGLLPCGNPGHKKLVKQNAKLEEELRLKDKKLTEQQKLYQELVKMHKKEMEEKERKREEERNRMEEQIRDKERTIRTLDTMIKNVLHGKEEDAQAESQTAIQAALREETSKYSGIIDEKLGEVRQQFEEQQRMQREMIEKALAEERRKSREALEKSLEEERAHHQQLIKKTIEQTREDSIQFCKDQQKADEVLRQRSFLTMDLFLESMRKQLQILREQGSTEPAKNNPSSSSQSSNGAANSLS